MYGTFARKLMFIVNVIVVKHLFLSLELNPKLWVTIQKTQ